MSSRRSRGDGGLHWDQSRQRWVATATVGNDGRGKRLVRHGYGRTKTEAKAKLCDLLRSREDGVVLTRDAATVRQIVRDHRDLVDVTSRVQTDHRSTGERQGAR